MSKSYERFDRALDVATPAGLADIRAAAAACLRRNVISFVKPAPAGEKPPGSMPIKHAFTGHGRRTALGAWTVAVGARLPEPFRCRHLVAATKFAEAKALNVIATWRRAGWIAKGPDGWRRTPSYGKTGQ